MSLSCQSQKFAGSNIPMVYCKRHVMFPFYPLTTVRNLRLICQQPQPQTSKSQPGLLTIFQSCQIISPPHFSVALETIYNPSYPNSFILSSPFHLDCLSMEQARHVGKNTTGRPAFSSTTCPLVVQLMLQVWSLCRHIVIHSKPSSAASGFDTGEETSHLKLYDSEAHFPPGR